uniref:Uncharacterized protein n=1 Tax=Meloidogyne enterolobii TaxID=390850 RepID=A0A6V7TKU4_MELEN|nr:unnamed protein product [Meloidogyne enterolobii]
MPCQLPEGIENVSDDVFSYMCNLAMEKCSDKGEKKKASCGGAAMRKRLLIKNFVAQMLSQEQQTKNLQQQYLDARECQQNSFVNSTTSWISSQLADDRHMEREQEDEMEEFKIREEYRRVGEEKEEGEDYDEVEGEEEEDDGDEEEEEEEEETAVAALLASNNDQKGENSFKPRYQNNTSVEEEDILLEEEENKEETISNSSSSTQSFSSISNYSTAANYGSWPNQLNEEKRGVEEDEFQKVPIQQNQFYAVENSLLSGNKDIYNGSWHFYGGIDTSFDSLNGGLLTENLMLDNDQQQNEHIDKLLEKDGNTTKLFLMERAAEPLIDEISEHSQQHLGGFSNMVPYIMKFSNEDTLFYNPLEGENQQQNSRCLTNLDNAKLVENENTHQQVDIFESRKRPWYSQSEWSHFEENSGGVCDDNHFEQHQQFSPLCCGFLQLQQFGNNSGTAQTCGNSTINEPLIKRVKL